MDSPEETRGDGAPQESTASTGASSTRTVDQVVSSSVTALEKAKRRFGGGGKQPPPDSSSGDDEDSDDDGMMRMSFLEHLEELRSRILRSLLGVAVSFVASLTFSNQLWTFVCQPAVIALRALGYDPNLVQITPMESFNVIYFKLPIVCSIFLSSPWILYQVWGFVSPGLYKKERRLAAPFILCSAGLFLLGGFFAYFVVFRFGLTFLLGVGRGNYVKPMVSVTEYFDLFVNVVLGVGVVFELPVLIFFLTLLRIVTPSFLVKHSRYAILLIFILAAVVTPTPDIFNLMLFAAPMCLLFYVGVFAGYLLTLKRENRAFPWSTVLLVLLAVLLLLAGGIYIAVARHALHWIGHWPYLVKQ